MHLSHVHCCPQVLTVIASIWSWQQTLQASTWLILATSLMIVQIGPRFSYARKSLLWTISLVTVICKWPSAPKMLPSNVEVLPDVCSNGVMATETILKYVINVFSVQGSPRQWGSFANGNCPKSPGGWGTLMAIVHSMHSLESPLPDQKQTLPNKRGSMWAETAKCMGIHNGWRDPKPPPNLHQPLTLVTSIVSRLVSKLQILTVVESALAKLLHVHAQLLQPAQPLPPSQCHLHPLSLTSLLHPPSPTLSSGLPSPLTSSLAFPSFLILVFTSFPSCLAFPQALLGLFPHLPQLPPSSASFPPSPAVSPSFWCSLPYCPLASLLVPLPSLALPLALPTSLSTPTSLPSPWSSTRLL